MQVFWSCLLRTFVFEYTTTIDVLGICVFCENDQLIVCFTCCETTGSLNGTVSLDSRFWKCAEHDKMWSLIKPESFAQWSFSKTFKDIQLLKEKYWNRSIVIFCQCFGFFRRQFSSLRNSFCVILLVTKKKNLRQFSSQGIPLCNFMSLKKSKVIIIKWCHSFSFKPIYLKTKLS